MNQNDGKLSNAEELLESFNLADTALAEFRVFGETAIPKIDDFVGDFYEWLETRPEYPQFFHDREAAIT